MTASQTHGAIDAVVRLEWARLIAGLARYTGDVGLAEELAQDAAVAALEQWPESGVPRNAGAGLCAILAEVQPSPVIEPNRAVAAYGPQVGLDLPGKLAAEPARRGYHLPPSVRGDLLMKLGRPGEAGPNSSAATMTRNAPEREMTLQRARTAAQVTGEGSP